MPFLVIPVYLCSNVFWTPKKQTMVGLIPCYLTCRVLCVYTLYMYTCTYTYIYMLLSSQDIVFTGDDEVVALPNPAEQFEELMTR